jgi:hypothetical protein
MKLIVAFAMIFFSTSVQSGANFAGTWVMERPASGGGGGMSGGGMSSVGAPASASNGMRSGGGATMGAAGGGGPIELVITQTATSLTMERRFAGVEPQTTTYKLDGSESTNVTGRTTLKTKSRWDGAKLVTEGTLATKTDQAEIKGTIKETRWLEKDGTLIVETLRQIDGVTPT